jgi:hypothetical protein
LDVSAGSNVLLWSRKSFVNGAPLYFSMRTQTPFGNFCK